MLSVPGSEMQYFYHDFRFRRSGAGLLNEVKCEKNLKAQRYTIVSIWTLELLAYKRLFRIPLGFQSILNNNSKFYVFLTDFLVWDKEVS